MTWLKSKTALLLQWYVDKRGDNAHFEWTMCYEQDLPYLTSSWIQAMYDDQLTIWNANGEQVKIKVEKVTLVKV